MKVKSESEVAQLCLTFSDPVDCSLPGSSVHGILLQARVLEWSATAFASNTSQTFFQNQMELLQKSKEEAYIMADAFRIAFEQQLMRKNDQALRLTQTDKMCKKATKWISWKHLKENGKYEL